MDVDWYHFHQMKHKKKIHGVLQEHDQNHANCQSQSPNYIHIPHMKFIKYGFSTPKRIPLFSASHYPFHCIAYPPSFYLITSSCLYPKKIKVIGQSIKFSISKRNINQVRVVLNVNPSIVRWLTHWLPYLKSIIQICINHRSKWNLATKHPIHL